MLIKILKILIQFKDQKVNFLKSKERILSNCLIKYGNIKD